MDAITEVKQNEVADYGNSLLEVIGKAARDPSVDIDKMERLLQMQERVQLRQSEVAFAEAFSQMQPALPTINMRGQIVHSGKVISEYAEWSDINKAISPILAEHGFSLSFKPAESSKTAVTAILRHRLGHSDTATLELPLDTSGAKNAVQAVGSSLTYGKRYAGVLILNLTIEGEDDDGAQSGPKIQHQAPRDLPFPQGPARNKTDLKDKGRAAWKEIEAVKSAAELDDKLDVHGPLLEQIKQVLPSWLSGYQRDGETFEGLDAIIARIRADFNAIDSYNNGGR